MDCQEMVIWLNRDLCTTIQNQIFTFNKYMIIKTSLLLRAKS